MNDVLPHARKDLEFVPVQAEGKQFVLVRDHLGLVGEGKAIALPIYQIIALLDGTRDLRELQMLLMRQAGGMLVGTEEVRNILARLDEAYLLDSDRFRKARDEIVEGFMTMKVRPASHAGRAYIEEPFELRVRLDRILKSAPAAPRAEGKVIGLVAPHIDLSVGERVYSSAYQTLRGMRPSRVVLLGVGHQMMGDLFSLTRKDFQTPLGKVMTDENHVEWLMEAGRGIAAGNDFAHRSEHSLEFQILFLQHLFSDEPFSIIPILCGSLLTGVHPYTREAYLQKAGVFLAALKEILGGSEDTLLVAGVDFSHIGPKFGHDMPASYLEGRSQAHDRELLRHLTNRDPSRYWEESAGVGDQFNVCGFSAMACLLEVLPAGMGHVLNHEIWHEQATSSAVSFAAVAFVA